MVRAMAIRVSPSACDRVFNSTAHTVEGAKPASTEPAAKVPIKIPDPLRNSRRAKGRFCLGTMPLSSQSLNSEATGAMGMVRMKVSCVF